MASYFPPKINTAFIMYVGLESVATAGAFQSNPTLASGDFKVSIDGGALANLTTLPTVTPASGKMVKISLSSSEMNGDNITIVCSDASGGEWKDLIVNLQTAARQVDDLAYPTTSGRSIDVTTTGEVGIDWANIGSPTTTVALSGTTAGLIDGAITAAKIGADAITAAKIADGAIDAATFAAGAINAAAIATDAIAAAKVAADAVTKIQNGLATPTNITAGTITTVTNLTNAPTAGDLTATMKTSVTTAATAATPTAAAVTGAVGSVTGNVGGNVTGSVGSVVGAVGSVTGAVGSVTSGVTVTTNNDKTGYTLSSAGIIAVWAYVIEGTTQAVHAMRLMLAALAGLASGGGTGTVVFRDQADTKDRISATVDANGNRTSVTTNVT